MGILDEWFKGDWFPLQTAQFYSTAWDVDDSDESGNAMQSGENEDEGSLISETMVENSHQELVKKFLKKTKPAKVTYCFKMRVYREIPTSECIYFVFAYDKKERRQRSQSK